MLNILASDKTHKGDIIMSYTEFRDTIRDLPDMKRHFAFAGLGLTAFGLITVGVPALLTGVMSGLAICEFSKRDDSGRDDFGRFDLKDAAKNCAASSVPLLLSLLLFGGTSEDNQNQMIGPQGSLEETEQLQTAQTNVNSTIQYQLS